MILQIDFDKKPEDLNSLEFLVLSCYQHLDEESQSTLGLTDESLIKLEEAKYIRVIEEESGETSFDIRAKALELAAEEVKTDNSKRVVWIDEYRKLFKEASSRSGIMGSKSGVEQKMRAFLKKNPKVTKEEVIGATKLYLQNLFDKTYMQQADYFISKNGNSRLEAYIEEYREKGDSQPETFFEAI